MLQKESQVVTGASLRKRLVQAIPACVRLASCVMSMRAGARAATLRAPKGSTNFTLQRYAEVKTRGRSEVCGNE